MRFCHRVGTRGEGRAHPSQRLPGSWAPKHLVAFSGQKAEGRGKAIGVGILVFILSSGRWGLNSQCKGGQERYMHE